MTSDSSNNSQDNSLFDGHYRLRHLISREGATADVWLAENEKSVDTTFSEEKDDIIKVEGSGVLVAIKIYRPQNALDVAGEQSFRQVFKTVYNFHHANLLPITDYSVCNGIPYLVMPYCENGSAENLILKLVDSRKLWKFIYDVASGLEYLHTSCPPIVHQDIKPGNILMDTNGNYCITDFGISVKEGIEDESALDNLHSGTTIYMAPERFGDDYKPVTSSDIWAFGATVYELITGDVPFGDKGGKVQEERSQVPTINVPVEKEIKKLVYSCLNADPGKRPSAKQIVEMGRSRGRNPMKRTITGFLVILLTVIGVLAYIMKPTPPDPFTVFCNSGDSIINILKQEAKSESVTADLDYAIANERLKRVVEKYENALKNSTKNVHKRDSVRGRIRAIHEKAFPKLETYRGASDTLQLVTDNELPIQMDKYSRKKEKLSEEYKQIIKDL